MKYVFHPEALTEYAEAIEYYTQQRIEVAQAFIDAVENAVYRARESPTSWSIVDEDARRCLTRRFPYGILYTVEPDYPVVQSNNLTPSAASLAEE
ncbi:MAG: type II toxin-antitoxin system RelE/ParE family toxin [Phormidesmis sp. CAN_BIN36]|nr:type II toxin-antitoxin system RelE/ParE family toxin [Phormidesmis sp. CAN_BIN36]